MTLHTFTYQTPLHSLPFPSPIQIQLRTNKSSTTIHLEGIKWEIGRGGRTIVGGDEVGVVMDGGGAGSGEGEGGVVGGWARDSDGGVDGEGGGGVSGVNNGVDGSGINDGEGIDVGEASKEDDGWGASEAAEVRDVNEVDEDGEGGALSSETFDIRVFAAVDTRGFVAESIDSKIKGENPISNVFNFLALGEFGDEDGDDRGGGGEGEEDDGGVAEGDGGRGDVEEGGDGESGGGEIVEGGEVRNSEVVEVVVGEWEVKGDDDEDAEPAEIPSKESKGSD
ncbi:hypothetical protein JAAARDRAFT_691874 [Jaapia argillacea MUCL 33604]|uniref:Uncharacterized protein n=1 Tax=Jaapia argillacea MUCL 33604 TaxID=933084 RepID=A0A067PLV2_9AGAM|nr:hypothetical protein JAAARDRAFT_691874 [Jaapia argillacea MUCL 33604]